MRAVFLGASTLTVMTARVFLEEGNEVVIIEQDSEKIEALSEDMDCGFICGDGSRPAILQEAGPEKTDILFAMSDSDQDNIIGSLVARSLGVDRIVTRIEDADFESVCSELGLEDTIVPDREVARGLYEMASGIDRAPLTGALGKGLRFFTVAVREQHAGLISELNLPEDFKIVAVTTGEDSRMADGDTEVQEKDRILLVVKDEDLKGLKERFEESSD